MDVQIAVELFYYSLIATYTLVIILFIYKTRKPGSIATDGGRHKGMDRREKIWMYSLIAVAILGNIIFFSPLLPSMQYNLYLDREPVKTVVIYMEDHKFILPENPIRIPLGEPVEFKVYSNDLTYGFGVFREDGMLIFQMQVVPSYENRIVWVFNEPGFYTIRSTEYSGPEHPYMYIENAILVEGGDSYGS